MIYINWIIDLFIEKNPHNRNSVKNTDNIKNKS